MATVHLYHNGKEITARTLVFKRYHRVESIDSWWLAARKALTGKDVPLEYEGVEIDPAWIRFKCADDVLVFIDRKRSML